MKGQKLERITTDIRWSLKPGDKIVVPGQGSVTFTGENNGEVVYEDENGEEGSALVAYVEKKQGSKKKR